MFKTVGPICVIIIFLILHLRSVRGILRS